MHRLPPIFLTLALGLVAASCGGDGPKKKEGEKAAAQGVSVAPPAPAAR